MHEHKMTDPKLAISIPVFFGLSLKLREIEIPVSRIITALRPIEEFSKPDAWVKTIHFALQYILDDMHSEGECRGGWGKSYAERYIRRTYPAGIPSDASRQPDSPSGTSMVVEGLNDLRECTGLTNVHLRKLIQTCLEETARYFVSRCDPGSGAVGVKTQLAGGDVATAYNLRHSAMAIKAWRSVPGQHERLGRCCEYLIRSAEEVDLESERPLTIAAVLSGLDWIEQTDHIRRSIPGTNRVPFLTKKAEIALFETWSETCGGWFDGKDRIATSFWYSAFVLKELCGVKVKLDVGLVERMDAALDMLLGALHELPEGQLGMPYRPNGSPDLGMSCLLAEILARPLPHWERGNELRGLCRFINSCCDEQNSFHSVYLEDTYPWTLASVFTVMRILLTKKQRSELRTTAGS